MKQLFLLALVAASSSAAEISGLYTRQEIMNIRDDRQKAWECFSALPVVSLLAKADGAAASESGVARGQKLLVVQYLRGSAASEGRDLLLKHVAAPLLAEFMKGNEDGVGPLDHEARFELLSISHHVNMSAQDRVAILNKILAPDSLADEEQVMRARRCLPHIHSGRDLSQFTHDQ